MKRLVAKLAHLTEVDWEEVLLPEIECQQKLA
jgi:hypothetical protein